jgi:hypothetical protein
MTFNHLISNSKNIITMKKYLSLLLLFAGLVACSTAPPPAGFSDSNEITVVQSELQTNPAIFSTAPEVLNIGNREVLVCKASLFGFLGENADIIAIVLLVFTSLFGGLWLKLRTKIKQIGELFLKAYEYTDDKKLDQQERDDLKKRFLEVISRASP